MQRLLALGVTVVVLENSSSRSLCCLPPILKEFRQLREFAFSLPTNCFLFPKSATSTVQSLSPTLRKLRFELEGAEKMLFPALFPEEPEVTEGSDSSLQALSIEPSPSGNIWSVKNAYPQLETLHLNHSFVWSLKVIAELPTSITNLRKICHVNNEDFEAFINALPPHLEKIGFGYGLPVSDSELLALLSRFSLRYLNWSTDLFDPEVIAQLPRTLTKIPCADRSLYPDGIAALPPALTNLAAIANMDGSPFFLDHIPELREFAGDEDPGPFFTVATIKRLPPKLNSINIAADLESMTVADWPPQLTSLEWTPLSSNFSLSVLPPLLTLLIQDPLFTIPMSMMGDLPRTLISLRCSCGPPEPNTDIHFPPNLDFMNLVRVGNDPWIVIEPTKILLPIDDEDDEDDGETNYEGVDLDPHDPEHLEASTAPLKVVSCFPFHCIPRGVHYLYLSCPIPASQLIHLPPRVEGLTAVDIFEDADFDPNDPRYLTKMTENFEIGVKEGINCPSSHCSLPASIASLLPRTSDTLHFRSGCIWRNCDWSRLPPLVSAVRSDTSSLLVDASDLFGAPLPKLRFLELPLTGVTDDVVKAMPDCLDVLLGSSPGCFEELTEASTLYWPCNLDTYFADEDDEESFSVAFSNLQEQRAEAVAKSSVEDICTLFPRSYLRKLYAK